MSATLQPNENMPISGKCRHYCSHRYPININLLLSSGPLADVDGRSNDCFAEWWIDGWPMAHTRLKSVHLSDPVRYSSSTLNAPLRPFGALELRLALKKHSHRKCFHHKTRNIVFSPVFFRLSSNENEKEWLLSPKSSKTIKSRSIFIHVHYVSKFVSIIGSTPDTRHSKNRRQRQPKYGLKCGTFIVNPPKCDEWSISLSICFNQMTKRRARKTSSWRRKNQKTRAS